MIISCVIVTLGILLLYLPSTRIEAMLCGEQEKKEAGYLDELNYLFYHARYSETSRDLIPVVIWLSGGPGCSSMIGAIFENGPCMYDEETRRFHPNPFSWSNAAHLIYIDQPYGTGFSKRKLLPLRSWNNQIAAEHLRKFIESFFRLHSELQKSSLYIFGESYAGHFVPDIAVHLLNSDMTRWSPVLKGIAIGNGFVSARAIMSSYVKYSRHNDYHVDFLASEAESLEQNLLGCIDFINDCMPFMTSEHRNCADASVCSEAENKVWQAITKSGKNYYDLRRTCAIEDSSGLCYEFDALQSLMNKPSVRTYFRSNGAQTWRVCNEEVYRDGASADFFQESEYEVAHLLNSGVRVLVYAGDADAVCNWVAQYNWTQNLEWKHSDSFRRSRTNNWMIDGAIAGTFRSSYNLTFVRVKNAGHVSDAYQKRMYPNHSMIDGPSRSTQSSTTSSGELHHGFRSEQSIKTVVFNQKVHNGCYPKQTSHRLDNYTIAKSVHATHNKTALESSTKKS